MTTDQFNKLPKWAQAEFTAQAKKHELQLALCWPSQPEPEPYTKEEIQRAIEVRRQSELAPKNPATVLEGWFTNGSSNFINSMVTKGCSNGHSHNRSQTSSGFSNSQGCGRMYKTAADAFLAARWEICHEVAKRLVQLDRKAKGAV